MHLLPTPSRMVPSRILVFYASQTGQAESISEFIHTEFISGKLQPVLQKLKTINQTDDITVERICASRFEEQLDFFENNTQQDLSYLLISVASTTGQGDPPDTALKFYRFLKKLQRSSKTQNILPFSHIQFALLGLGDTNYDNFAQFSKNLNRLFSELGAVPIVDTKYADDAGELETVTEPFILNLINTLLKVYSIENSTTEKIMENPKTEISSEPTELITSIEKLRIDENNLTSTVENRGETPGNDIISKYSTNLLCKHRNSDEVTETNKLINSLRGPFTTGDASEYRKMPLQKALLENDDVLKGTKVNSVLQFFQNKHDVFVHDAFAVPVPDQVLTESKTPLCYHREKTDFKVELNIKMSKEQIENDRCFIPGDSYGIYCMNSFSDIYTICQHAYLEQKDDKNMILLNVLNSKRDASTIYLKHQNNVYELFAFLCYCVNTRTIVKRNHLYRFSQCATKPEDSLALKEISTRKTNKLYETVILPNHITICDVLRIFSSIQISIYELISMLNPPKPRYFSLSSSPKIDKLDQTQLGEIWITLKNSFPSIEGRTDENVLGQFSGKFFFKSAINSNENISDEFQKNFSSLPIFNCSNRELTPRVPIFVFLKANTFNISLDFNRPSLFFSAGTGLSPFLSYLKERKIQTNDMTNVLLFHGARNQDLILEKEALIKYFIKNNECSHEEGLFIALSRQKTDVSIDKTLQNHNLTFGHISDAMKNNCKSILNLILTSIDNPHSKENEPYLSIYICGAKAFENNVKLILQNLTESSSNFKDNFYQNSLLNCIQVDQW